MTQAQDTAKAGTLDPTFADGGVLNWAFPEVSSLAPQAVVSLPDGKLIAVSRLSGFPVGFAVVRLTAGGKIDAGTGFGTEQQGFVEISFPDTHIPFILGAGLLADAGVLIACEARKKDEAYSKVAIIRLLKDGRLDESFGDGGVVFLDPLSGGTPDQAKKMEAHLGERKAADPIHAARKGDGNSLAAGVEQPDGKIVVMTSAADYSVGEYKGLVVRLNSNGTFDKTFNGTGRAFVELEGTTGSYGSGLAIQADGKLVVFGPYFTPGNDIGMYVTRFNANGKQDPLFSTLMLPSQGDQLVISDIAVRRKDGLIALVGDVFEGLYSAKGAIFVLNRDGDFNLVFNGGKPHYSKLTDMGQTWRRCAFGGDGDDKLIISGVTGSDAQTDNTLALTARYLLTGELDLTFNRVGWVVFDNRNWLDVMFDMTTTAQGQIVVCGEYAVKGSPIVEGGWMIRYLA